MTYKVKSPVLFIVFNRPKETAIVFDAIRKAQPSKLYVAADGPRNSKSTDKELSIEARNIVKNIDWDCEVRTLFRDENLGCRDAVSGAVSWFFDNEPEGIVLEDDCLPSADFFRFADEMLEHYRHDEKIAHICGCNFQDGIKRGDSSFYFSNITHVWGWAGWRRVWERYDVNMKLLDEALKTDFINALTTDKRIKLFMKMSFRKTQKKQINTWDYQYGFLNLFSGKVAIIPNNNMISNIGFNENGTHTLSDSEMANIPFEPLKYPLKYPDAISVDHAADDYTLQKEVPSAYVVIKETVKFSIKMFIKRILRW